MKTHPCIRRTMLGVLLALLVVPAAWAQKIEVQIDEEDAKLAETVREMLAGNAHFQYTGADTIEAVVVVWTVESGAITNAYHSAPVTLRPRVTFTPAEEHLPGTAWYPEGIVRAPLRIIEMEEEEEAIKLELTEHEGAHPTATSGAEAMAMAKAMARAIPWSQNLNPTPTPTVVMMMVPVVWMAAESAAGLVPDYHLGIILIGVDSN